VNLHPLRSLDKMTILATLQSIILSFFTCWGAISVLTYLVPQFLANIRGVQNLKNKYRADWALVTGASSGIGKAIVIELAQQGLNVVLVALEDTLLDETFEEMRKRFPELQFRSVGVNLGLGDGSYLKPIADKTKDIHISLVFNNAGFIVTGFFHATALEKHMANVHCNAISAVAITHHFISRMYESGRPGLICFTSSAAASIPSPFTAMYSATKAFITRFATSLAAEAGPQGVDVMAVHPSPVQSNFLVGTAKIKVMDDFYKFSTGPEAVPDMIFRKAGRGQVMADLGTVAVVMRLITKLLDENFFASSFAALAGFLPDYKEQSIKAKFGKFGKTAGA